MNKDVDIKIPHTNPPSSDVASKEEERLIRDGYENKFHKTKHYIRTSIVWLLFVLAAGITIVWVLHLLLPNEHRWLDAQNLLELKSIIVGAILGGVSSIISRFAFK